MKYDDKYRSSVCLTLIIIIIVVVVAHAAAATVAVVVDIVFVVVDVACKPLYVVHHFIPRNNSNYWLLNVYVVMSNTLLIYLICIHTFHAICEKLI